MRDVKTDAKDTHTYTTNIRCTLAEYKRNRADKKRAELVNTCPEIKVDMFLTEVVMPNQDNGI